MANWKGTAVPNNEYVEKLYINTNLSLEEVLALLEPFDVNSGTNTLLTYGSNDLTLLSLVNANLTPSECTYLGNFNSLEVYLSSADNFDYANFVGWNSNFNGVIDVNDTVSNVVDNIEALSSLISITPFTQDEPITNLPEFLTGIADAIREKKGTTNKINAQNFASEIESIEGGSGGGGGSGIIEVDELPSPTITIDGIKDVVPNSGYLDAVYMNTSLNESEIKNILEQQTNYRTNTDDGAKIVTIACTNTNSTKQLLAKWHNDYLTIWLSKNGNKTYLFNTDSSVSTPFTGWNPNHENYIVFGDTAIDRHGTHEVGVENDKLIDLFYVYTSKEEPNPEVNKNAIYKCNERYYVCKNNKFVELLDSSMSVGGSSEPTNVNFINVPSIEIDFTEYARIIDLTQNGIYYLENMYYINDSVIIFNFGKSKIDLGSEGFHYYVGKLITLDGFIDYNNFYGIATGSWEYDSSLYLPCENITNLLRYEYNTLIIIVKDNTVEVRLSGTIENFPS